MLAIRRSPHNARRSLNAPMLPWAVLLMVGIVVWDACFRKERQTVWPEAEHVYRAVVISEPVVKPKTMAVDLLLTDSRQKIIGYIHKDVRSSALTVGDGIVFRGRIAEINNVGTGTFDYKRYMETHGFTGSVYVAGGKWQKQQLSLRQLSWTQRCRLYFLKLRHGLLQRYRYVGIEGDEYGVIAAMTLGDKSALTPELRETYSISGASHVLALSGLHLGIIVSLLSLFVVGRRFRVATHLLVITCIWAFAFLVGLPPSVVRSAVMFSIYGLLSLGARHKMSLNVLAVTAICMLMANPETLFDVGFQMSFLAVLGILLWMPLFDCLMSARYMQEHPVVKWLWSLLTVSVAAQLGVAPLIAYYFGRFSTFFLLTNLVAIPSVFLILHLSLLILAIPQIAAPLLVLTAWFLNSVLGLLSRLPIASIDGLHPTVVQVAIIYAVLMAANLWLRQKAPVRR